MNMFLDSISIAPASAVLRSTSRVVAQARHVWIDSTRLPQLAQGMVEGPDHREPEPENFGTLAESVTCLLLLAAWEGTGGWRPNRKRLRGYEALSFALRRSLDQGFELDQPERLRRLSKKTLSRVFQGGKGALPSLEAAREIGRYLVARWDGDAGALVKAANGSAVRLLELLLQTFPCFEDCGLYLGSEVKLYGQAQRLLGRLSRALPEELSFRDLGELTASAGMTTTRALEARGVLRYAPQMEVLMSKGEAPAQGDWMELELRSASVWAVELLRRELETLGLSLCAYQIEQRLGTFPRCSGD